MGKRITIVCLLATVLVAFLSLPAYSASSDPCCPDDQELRYLLQPPSGVEFRYQVRHESFFSSYLGRTKNFFLVLPPDFDPHSSQRYPLLILLHGYNFHRNGSEKSACNPQVSLDIHCQEREEEYHWLLLEDIAPIAGAMMDRRNKTYRDLKDDLTRRFDELAVYEGPEKDYSPSQIAASLVEHNLHPDGKLDDPFDPITPMIILLPDGDNGFYTDEDGGKGLFPPTREEGGCDVFSPEECMMISRVYPRYMKPGALGKYESYTLELMEYLRTTYPLRTKILPSPHTGIGGFSMGGFGALKIALRHPELFSSVSSQSGLVDIELLTNKLQIKTLLPEFLEVFGSLAPMALPSSSTINEPYRRAHNPLRLIREGMGGTLRNAIYVDYGAAERYTWIIEGNKGLDEALGGASRMIPVQPYNGKAGHNHFFWRSRLGNVLEYHSRLLR